jgi:hypothetical protein
MRRHPSEAITEEEQKRERARFWKLQRKIILTFLCFIVFVLGTMGVAGVTFISPHWWERAMGEMQVNGSAYLLMGLAALGAFMVWRR